MDKALLHKKISYYKSALRIVACVLFMLGTSNPWFIAGSLGFLVGELGGIAEEVWGA